METQFILVHCFPSILFFLGVHSDIKPQNFGGKTVRKIIARQNISIHIQANKADFHFTLITPWILTCWKKKNFHCSSFVQKNYHKIFFRMLPLPRSPSCRSPSFISHALLASSRHRNPNFMEPIDVELLPWWTSCAKVILSKCFYMLLILSLFFFFSSLHWLFKTPASFPRST